MPRYRKPRKVVYAYESATIGTDVVSEVIANVKGEWVVVGGHVSSNLKWARSDTARDSKYAGIFPQGVRRKWVDNPAEHPIIGHLFMKETHP